MDCSWLRGLCYSTPKGLSDDLYLTIDKQVVMSSHWDVELKGDVLRMGECQPIVSQIHGRITFPPNAEINKLSLVKEERRDSSRLGPTVPR